MKLAMTFIVGSRIVSRRISVRRYVVAGQPRSMASTYAATSSESSMSSFWGFRTRVFLESASAMTSSLLEEYSTIGLYRMGLISSRWQRIGVSSMILVFISGTNGRWSVSNLNSLSPTRYLENFYKNTPAIHSFSSCEYTTIQRW